MRERWNSSVCSVPGASLRSRVWVLVWLRLWYMVVFIGTTFFLELTLSSEDMNPNLSTISQQDTLPLNDIASCVYSSALYLLIWYCVYIYSNDTHSIKVVSMLFLILIWYCVAFGGDVIYNNTAYMWKWKTFRYPIQLNNLCNAFATMWIKMWAFTLPRDMYI